MGDVSEATSVEWRVFHFCIKASFTSLLNYLFALSKMCTLLSLNVCPFSSKCRYTDDWSLIEVLFLLCWPILLGKSCLVSLILSLNTSQCTRLHILNFSISDLVWIFGLTTCLSVLVGLKYTVQVCDVFQKSFWDVHTHPPGYDDKVFLLTLGLSSVHYSFAETWCLSFPLLPWKLGSFLLCDLGSWYLLVWVAAYGVSQGAGTGLCVCFLLIYTGSYENCAVKVFPGKPDVIVHHVYVFCERFHFLGLVSYSHLL